VVHMAALVAGVAVTFLVNIFAGYWRAYAKRARSKLEWALAVHAPVPLVALLRRWAGVGFNAESAAALAVFVAAYFLGQRVGGMLHGVAARRIGAPGRNLLRDLPYIFSTGPRGAR
jgi:hypothetical protein